VADDEEAEVRYARAIKLLLDLHQQANVLLDGEPAHESENALASSPLRMRLAG